MLYDSTFTQDYFGSENHRNRKQNGRWHKLEGGGKDRVSVLKDKNSYGAG